MATTVQQSHVSGVSRSALTRYLIDWESTAGGSYTDTITLQAAGELIAVSFGPGSPAPDANYDVVITDEEGVDILAGQGANLSATVSTMVTPGIPVKDGTTTSVGCRPVMGDLSLSITNAGASKQGKIVLWVR